MSDRERRAGLLLTTISTAVLTTAFLHWYPSPKKTQQQPLPPNCIERDDISSVQDFVHSCSPVKEYSYEDLESHPIDHPVDHPALAPFSPPVVDKHAIL